jgi:hypothetical protein
MRRTKKQDVINSVSVDCPRCGRSGHAKIERLNRSFVCRECQAKFYIDHTGQRVLGDPPWAKARAKDKDKAAERDGFENLPPKHARSLRARMKTVWRTLVYRWQSCPSWARVSIVAAPAVLLAAALLIRSWLPARDDLPTALLERARFVGGAFGRDDEGDLRAISAGWSGGAAADWMAADRPADWPTGDETTPVNVEAKIAFQNDAAREASVMLTVYCPGRAFDAAGGTAATQLKTYWTLGEDGLWYLDGRRTLAR